MSDTFIPSQHLTFETVMQERERLLHFLTDLQADSFLLDLSDVLDCDSAGLAFLIEAKKMSLRCVKKCHYFGLSDSMRSFIQFFGIESLLAEKTC